MLSLGETIRRLRESGGLTQKELARRVGVTTTYLSHLEGDRRDPSVGLLRSLAKEVKVPIEIFVSIALLEALPARDRRRVEPLLTSLLDLGVGRLK